MHSTTQTRLRSGAQLLSDIVRRAPGDLRYLASWATIRRRGRTTLEARVPYMPLSAVQFLEHHLYPGSIVFEWGGGGSTLWFADRVRTVIAVEHDRAWYAALHDKLSMGTRAECSLLLREPQPLVPETPAGYLSSECVGNFQDYVHAIDAGHDEALDLVLVDGRCRASCLLRAASKVRPGGMLVLDDSDRDRYQSAAGTLAHWQRRDF